ncbi:MAG TPA: lipase maturation factor family protein [Gammaproteobacteria bacterium]|nr:lipase maturation factor family protein [Gammaproteobacteria bacterium]
MTASARPLLIYDGDCGFCVYWVRYWQRLTGEVVRYASYQEVGHEFPHISIEEFRRAIYFVAADGKTYKGAAAAYLVLVHAGRGFWWWLYRRVPLYAWFSECCYNFVAQRRVAAHWLSRWLWGRERVPETHTRVTWLLLRGLGLIYLFAFASYAVQVEGLIGARGILPLQTYLSLLHEHLGTRAYFVVPNVFWFDASDAALHAVCWTGVLASVLLTVGFWQRAMLILLYALYLSLTHAGQVFMTFQWDMLLLEAGFLGIFLPGGSPVIVWLFRWLTFRFMFLAGAAKITSGDVTWRNLTALNYHFETQPLPTPLAWYAHQSPSWLLEAGVVMTLLVELVLVFLIFLPRRPRMLAAWCILSFETFILLTGNYNFFNLLVMLLCVSLFDDQAFNIRAPCIVRVRSKAVAWMHGVLAVLLVSLGLIVIESQLTRHRPPEPLAEFRDFFVSYFIVSPYGLFANMTTRRPEIVIEGSNNQLRWAEYEFKYKPSALNRRPLWNFPHQPRLDWQMWFAALGDPRSEWWFGHLLQRLLENSPPVTALFERNPFPDSPPRYIRALLYDYHFTSYEERRETGHWWKRELLGTYFPIVSLKKSAAESDEVK